MVGTELAHLERLRIYCTPIVLIECRDWSVTAYLKDCLEGGKGDWMDVRFSFEAFRQASMDDTCDSGPKQNWAC